jgi:hypothetical protein
MDELDHNESEPKECRKSVLSWILLCIDGLATLAGLCVLMIHLINENRHVVIEPYDINPPPI